MCFDMCVHACGMCGPSDNGVWWYNCMWYNDAWWYNCVWYNDMWCDQNQGNSDQPGHQSQTQKPQKEEEGATARGTRTRGRHRSRRGKSNTQPQRGQEPEAEPKAGEGQEPDQLLWVNPPPPLNAALQADTAMQNIAEAIDKFKDAAKDAKVDLADHERNLFGAKAELQKCGAHGAANAWRMASQSHRASAGGDKLPSCSNRAGHADCGAQCA